ncbi:MAG: diguanylate cyclase (GGDEF)-like protein/PAS domain S-box-containing protein, partial [Phenylobacterium sp.]
MYLNKQPHTLSLKKHLKKRLKKRLNPKQQGQRSSPCLTLLCLLLLTGLWQQALAFHLPAQKLDDRFSEISFNQPLHYQRADKQISFDEINNDPELHHSWQSTDNPNPSFRLDNEALWLTSAVKNANKDPLNVIIDLQFPLADEVDFYVMDSSNNRLVTKFATGTDYTYTRRAMPYRSFAFELTLRPGQEVNIYLRIVDSGMIFANWSLWNKKDFHAQKLKLPLLQGILFGTLIILALLNLLIFIGLKERLYFYYAGFIVSFTLLTAILNGTAFQYLWPDTPEVNQSSVYVVSGIVLLFISLFSQVPHQKNSGRIIRTLQYINIVGATAVIFLPLLAPINYHLPVLVFTAIIIVLVGTFSALWRAFKRGQDAIFHASVWLIFLLAGSLYTLSRFGLVNAAWFGQESASIGIIFTALIVSMSLVKRIRLERSETEQARTLAAETLQQYFDIYQNAVEGLFTLSLKGTLISANPQLVTALGYKNLAELRKNIADKGVSALLMDLDESQKLLNEVVKKGAVNSREIQGLKKDGAHLWGLLSMRISQPPADGGEEFIHGAVVDITEKHQAYQKLAYMATHDPLTGVLNRSEFEKKLYKSLTDLKQSGQPSTMLYLDLERFKLINDTSGHIAGDSLLRQISDQLKTALNDQGIIARLGGDEFAILLDGIDGNDAFVIAYRIVEAVKEFRFLWEERIFTVGVSIGMKALSVDDSSLTQILTSADAACYIAKEKGRNRIHIYNEEDSDVQHHQSQMEWISVINDALDNDQFLLYYQYIVPVDGDAEQIHYEILLRMQDKEQNIIGPDSFIPSAERYHLMTNIDRWVIRTYFRWLSQNKAHMKKLSLCSINLSGTSIADPHFKDVVQELFVEYLIPHQKICFEITESVAIINLNATLEFISWFKQLGCQFSLDDFGTGFSSYGYLKSLPVDLVKIDGSFVKDLMIDPIDRAMVNSINEVAKAIGMRTVAEFVESTAILAELKVLGVDYAQGYGIHRPSP